MVRDLWLRYLHIWRQSGQGIRRWFIDPEETDALDTDSQSNKNTTHSKKKKRVKKRKRINDEIIKRPEGNFVHVARKASVNSVVSSDSTKAKDKILVPPSRQLLLGFLYLACRSLRSYVIPGDFVRWASEGALPICNLWGSSCIPDSLKDKIRSASTAGSRFIAEQYTTVTSLPTASNVYYQACVLAKMLEMPMPPLNAPLVARHMIQALQLPPEVWVVYTNLIQLFYVRYRPLSNLDPFDEHYVERIAAAILLACRLCPSWTSWGLCQRLEKSNDNNSTFHIPIPNHISQLDNLMRYQLPQFTKQIENNILPSSKTLSWWYDLKRPYNSLLENLLNKCRDEEYSSFSLSQSASTLSYQRQSSRILPSRIMTSPLRDSHHAVITPLQLQKQKGKNSRGRSPRIKSGVSNIRCVWPPVIHPVWFRCRYSVRSSSTYESTKHPILRKRKFRIRRKKNRPIDSETPFVCPYLKENPSADGILQPEQIVLLERIANYVCIWPSLLLGIFKELEQNMFDVLSKTSLANEISAFKNNLKEPNESAPTSPNQNISSYDVSQSPSPKRLKIGHYDIDDYCIDSVFV